MRIRITRSPTELCIDGIQLDRFVPGQQYQVGASLGTLFLAEGWAELVADEEPALLIPLPEPPRDPANSIRESFPPYHEGPFAADRRKKSRPPLP
jgi:hypothetical protein